MPQIAVGGESLNYLREGKGAPLLLVHSLGTASWLWREQIARWSRHFDVIAFDVRGHGASTHNGPVTTRAIAEDLLQALHQLDLLPVTAVGISMGGPILARLHELDPRAINRFVIADSFATQGEAGQTRAKMLSEKIAAIGIQAFGQIYADETILPSTDRRHHAELRDSVARCDQDAYTEAVNSVFTEDVRDILRTITVPTLVVVGEKDNRTPPALSEAIAALVPDSVFRTIPEAAHLANLDNPDGFHTATDSFLLGSTTPQVK
jgi:3-oxoadipate enol-lactonase